MNNISFILLIFSLLVASSLSAETGFTPPKENLAPSNKEVRDAVVKALLAQENQTKKNVIKPLKTIEKSDVGSQVLMKAKLKDQDKQRGDIRNIVATANKQRKKEAENKKRLLAMPTLTKKDAFTNNSSVTSITVSKSKEGAMTRVVIAEEDKATKNEISEKVRTNQGVSPKISSNETVSKTKYQTINIPVGRNKLATKGVGKQHLAGKNIIEILDTKQKLVSQLSRNIMTTKPELQLSAVDGTPRGRNEPVIKRVKGWIYLGRFESGVWENKTLNVEKQLPQVGKQYDVKATSLYVRHALPKKGKMGKIIHAFHSNDKIKILNLKGLGRNRDFYWAEISRD